MRNPERLGRFVWMRKPFCFRPANPALLAASFRRWSQQRFGEVRPAPESPCDYPVEFLKIFQELDLFKPVGPEKDDQDEARS